MQLVFKPFDGRSFNMIDVLDEDSHRKVGVIRSKMGSLSGIEVSLFDRKYEANVSSYQECLGFVRGVHAVLNRMTSADDGRANLENELYHLRQAEGS